LSSEAKPKTRILHIRCASREAEDHVNAIIESGAFPPVPEDVAVVVSYVWRNPFWKRLNEVEFEVIDLGENKRK
jgi:hypothetical protein